MAELGSVVARVAPRSNSETETLYSVDVVPRFTARPL